MSNLVIERHNIARSILLKDISKGLLGTGLDSMDIGSADHLALQDLQISEHSTDRTLPKYNLPRCSPGKRRHTSSHPDATLFVPVKKVSRTNSWYPLRSRGRRGGKRDHSAPATVALLASKVCYPSQLFPGQRHIHLMEVKHCEDIRPKN
eukprot:1161163-Pelagomonas_calceolata.AAC.9